MIKFFFVLALDHNFRATTLAARSHPRHAYEGGASTTVECRLMGMGERILQVEALANIMISSAYSLYSKNCGAAMIPRTAIFTQSAF